MEPAGPDVSVGLASPGVLQTWLAGLVKEFASVQSEY